MKKVKTVRYLDTVGDGSGTKNAIGDYSSAAEEFLFIPQVGELFKIHRLIVSIEDTVGLGFGNYLTGSSLTNGIDIDYKNFGVDINLTDNVLIKTIGHWGRLCFDVDVKTTGGGNDLAVARWSFDKLGDPLTLGPDDDFTVTLNDSFTGLVSHYFSLEGERWYN